MSKEKILVINSRDRQSGTTTEFELFFKDSSCQQVQKVLIKDVFCPNLFFNITEDNNILAFQQGANTLTTAISTGQYTIDQLIVALKTAIDAVLTGGTIVTITKSLTEYTLIFTFTGGAINAISFYVLSTISKIIGLNADTPPLSVNQMQEPYNLVGIEYVQVHSPQLGETHGLDGGTNGYISLVETISMTNTPFGSTAYRQNNDDELSSIIYDQPRNLSRINIVLRDDTGKKLVLPTNCNFSIMIKIYFD